MLKRLAQIVMGYPPPSESQCKLCSARHSVERPFVEGPSGFLICRNCVATTFNLLLHRLDQQTSTSKPDIPANVEGVQMANPYAPPLIPTSREHLCKLCGSVMAHADEQAGICDTCIVYSMELLDGHMQKR